MTPGALSSVAPSTDPPPQEIAPETLEPAVTRVWQELFQRESVGPDENFFELGGNSLLAMDLTELLEARFGLQISVLTLFQHPTIRELTAIIATGAEAP